MDPNESLPPDPRALPCKDDDAKKGNVRDTKPWAKSADAPKQVTPFKNLTR